MKDPYYVEINGIGGEYFICPRCEKEEFLPYDRGHRPLRNGKEIDWSDISRWEGCHSCQQEYFCDSCWIETEEAGFLCLECYNKQKEGKEVIAD